MFTTQYLNSPDQTNQQPPMFDVKNSPLALLAQTCNSIGKDVIPFNRTLSTSTSTTFSILPCNGSRGHDPSKNDDHSREHLLRCSSEDDVTSTMMTSSKARDYSRKNNDARKNSTSSEQNCEDDHLDVVGLTSNRIQDRDDEAIERNSEPIPLISKQNKTPVSKAKGTQATKSSNSAGSSSKRNASAKHGSEGSSKKNENRNSKDHRMVDHSKKPDSWLINLPFKPTGFAPGIEGIYPGYFNFFPPDYTNFLKNYYMSQINAHPSSSPFLNFSYSSFSDQLSKLRTSPQSLYSFSPLQPPPHSPPSAGAKSRSDLYGKQLNNPERSLQNNFLPSPFLANPLLQSSKDLQNLSYLHFLSQQNPMLLSAHAPLSCPFPFKPIGESCSKLFGSFDEVMDHVKLHWAEGKDPPPFDPSMFSIFPPLAYPPYAWSLKAYEDSPQQVGKFTTAPGISNRFHPYVKPFLSNHVP